MLARLRNLPHCDNRLTFVTFLAGSRHDRSMRGFFFLWYVPQCLTTTTTITIIIIILLPASQSFFDCFLPSVDVHPLPRSAILSLSSLHLTSPPSYTNPLADLTPAYTGERRLQSSSNLLPSRKLPSLRSHRLPIKSYRRIQLRQPYIQHSTHEADFLTMAVVSQRGIIQLNVYDQ